MKEVWKDIIGLNNLYQISNYGRIKSLKRNKILRTTIDKGGYSRIVINKKGYLIHQLVAKHFIPNPDNKPFVLHKKRILSGGTNSVDNLYWGTRSDNVKDSIKDGTWNKPRRKKYSPRSIKQYDLNGNYIKTWKGATHTPFNPSHILEVCNGKRKTANGYIWKYN